MNESAGGRGGDARASRCPFLEPARLFDDLAAAREAEEPPIGPPWDAPVIAGYADVVQALHDPATFSSSVTNSTVPPEWKRRFEGRIPTRGTLLGSDNPDHDRMRGAMNTFFVPRRLARYEPWMREQAHRLVDEFVEQGQVELKTAFGLPLPLRVICKLVGLDPERAEWVGRALSFYQGDRDLQHPGTREEKVGLLFELHDHLRELMALRREHREDDLISHIWNERDAGVQMDDMEMLSLFPGLMLAGHETTSNLICMALSHLLAEPSRWEWAQRDDEHRARAIEELLRFESAITGMTRLVTADTQLGTHRLRAGQRVLLAYAGGSRDPEVFDHPDEIDFDRPAGMPHLGFGQGVHACLGAPLARLLLRIELEVLHERLPGLRLVEPYEDRQYTVVSEGRGMVRLPLAWEPQPRRVVEHELRVEPEARRVPVVVASRREVAEGVVELVLEPSEGATIDDWQPGAHVDLRLPNGIERQYSISGGEPGRLRLTVLREPVGRGSSAYIADRLRVGDRVEVGAPRNHFALRASSFALLVAGGIGITPLLPMIEELERRGTGWRLLYLGASRSRMAYADELVQRYGSKVYIWPKDERGRFDLSTIADRLPTSDSVVYACGPERLLEALEECAEPAYADRLVMERFAPRIAEFEPNRAFDVELARSGEVLRVPEDRSVLEVINEAGAGVLSTCREGTCGTCEVRVLAGDVEHRDSVLDARERLGGRTMMTCVSRCRSERLVLDL